MNEAKKDRRVRHTRSFLRNAMMQLMTEKELKDITVKELCEAADINRGTFYTHYHDIYDLVEQIEEEIFEEISSSILRHSIKQLYPNEAKVFPMFLEIFDYLVNNAQLCIAFLGKNKNQSFIDRIANVGREQCMEAWKEVYKLTDEKAAQYFYSFAVSGCIGILQYWLDQGRKESAQELAQYAEQMVLNGVNMLQSIS